MKKLLLASVVSATFAVPAFAADQADVVVVGAGGLNAAETKHQEKNGIKDSIETHFNDTMKGGKYLNNPDLVHKLTDNAKYSVDFINDLGGDLTDVGMMAGATNKRTHRPT